MKYYLSNPYLGRILIALFGDGLALLLSSVIAFALVPTELSGLQKLGVLAAAGAVMVSVIYVARGYAPTTLGSHQIRFGFIPVAGAVGLGAAALLHILLPPDLSGAPTRAILWMTALFPGFLFVDRMAFRRIAHLPRFNQRVLLIGASELSEAVAHAIQNRPRLGIEIIGVLSDEIDPETPVPLFAGIPILGRVNEIEKVVKDCNITQIVVASKSRDEHFPAEELLAAKMRRIRVESGIAFFERVTGRIYLRDLRASYLIFSEGFRPSRLNQIIKRSLDFSASAIGLFLAGPVLALAAIAIKLDSPGPVFFKQPRLGLGGKTFDVIKLRSMVTDAEAAGPQFAQKQDSRITRVGGFIRKTRIDELPQLFNILKGEMSLVGPRPERPEIFEELCDHYPYFRLRCSVKPGCTGWAQVRHGYVNDIDGFEEKLALDLFYLKYGSASMDMLILWDTARTVVLLEGI